jgi:dinuclear metal center YbgI/SA1388 family protein
MNRDELVDYLDEYLQIRAIEDISDNGLQVEGREEIEHLAFAVDAGQATFEAAQAAAADMLIVHHGLFWSRVRLVTGIHRRRLASLLSTGLSLYAAHLPLDVHEEVGNNATLARWLGLEEVQPFGEHKGLTLGMAGDLPVPLSLDEFVAQTEEALGQPTVKVWPFGPSTVRHVGIVSGDAGSLLAKAAEADLDVYLTGEMNHSVYHEAREHALNVVYGGHYATETAGLKALAEHLSDRFQVETTFLDLPTGA